MGLIVVLSVLARLVATLVQVPAIVPLLIVSVLAGVVITWALGAFAVVMLFDVTQPIAVPIGAILIVSGPSVVMPILGSRKLAPGTRWRPP